ncbi:MAG: hypothetical protein DRI57_31045 [Deltaproteobacteria bacterium]|nr:MAG: hypothetical protein DRI57_31045 [Deltaproteobacteria bacterium]
MKNATQNHPQGKGVAGLKLVSGTGNSAGSKNNFITNLFREISAFRILWGLTLATYACIGAGAAFVSFLIEQEAFFKITQQVCRTRERTPPACLCDSPVTIIADGY